jgi:hypothetical protein
VYAQFVLCAVCVDGQCVLCDVCVCVCVLL